MKIGYVQNSPQFWEKERNFEEIRSLLKNVRADLLVLPNYLRQGYTFVSQEEARELAETTEGETADFS